MAIVVAAFVVLILIWDVLAYFKHWETLSEWFIHDNKYPLRPFGVGLGIGLLVGHLFLPVIHKFVYKE